MHSGSVQPELGVQQKKGGGGDRSVTGLDDGGQGSIPVTKA